MKEIPLTKGYVALVDDEDYERLSMFKWCVAVCKKKGVVRTAYARRCYTNGHKPQLNEQMHRVVVGALDGQIVDHIDGNGLNNTKGNLRITDHKGNGRNRRKSTSISGRKPTSIFKGVSWRSHEGRWVAKIRSDGKQRTLGYFKDETDAARAYDAAAISIFGEHAVTNRAAFPELGEG